MELVDCGEAVAGQVIAAAITVHRILGPGLLESAYEKALVFELQERGLKVDYQVDVPLIYKANDLGTGFKADIIVEDSLLLELKAVDKLTDIHIAQVITYLKLLKIKRGFLLNFNQKLMKNGIKRISI
ncbi:MAG TPA: GxxExxY protein [Gammaproteobacteria bacterium]